MGDRTRAEFLTTAGGAALAASLPSPARAAVIATRIQGILDAAVDDAHRAGRSAAAYVAGAFDPSFGSGQIFVSGAPLAARDHQRTIPLDRDTPFLIGSITKVFTSRIFAMRRGGYGGTLGDTLRVGLPARLAALRVLDIAHYGSGFPSDDDPPIWTNGTIDGQTLPLLAKSLRSHTELPQCDPGAQYSYSNLSWGLLGLASLDIDSVDRPAADEWIEAVRALGGALGLHATTPWTAATADGLAAGYNGNTLLAEGFSYGARNWPTLGGGGDLASTGTDMLAWLGYNMGRTGRDTALLREQQTATQTFKTQAPPVADIGPCVTRALPSPLTTSLGWFHAAPRWNRGIELLWKNGGVQGFTSWMGFRAWAGGASPSRTGVFVLANDKSADALGMRIARDLLGSAR
jgi:CubicO group peptidase (beta-lactamase class C family)